jgi:hypothetical protein
MSLTDHLHERRYSRYKVNKPIQALVFWDEVRTRAIGGRCDVLSVGGLGATLDDQLRVGETIRIQLTDSLSVYAVVRNVSGFKHGLEFVLLRQSNRDAIEALCERYAEDYTPPMPPVVN